MKVDLTESVAELLDGTNFATIATLDPDGGPHTVVVSVIRDGNTVLVSTTVDSNKTHNLERDPRISV
jgi:PPOX class probable F420-dependent enzyme